MIVGSYSSKMVRTTTRTLESMEKTQKNILFAEFINSAKYLERILQGIVHFSPLAGNTQVRELCTKLYHELFGFLEEFIINSNFSSDERSLGPEPKEVFEEYQQVVKLIEAMIRLNLSSNYSTKAIVDLINLLYRYSNSLHNEVMLNSNLIIDYPRVNLTQLEQGDEGTAPNFSLNSEHILKANNQDKVISLDFKRADKYQDLIKEGHRQIYEKNYERAQDYFEMAANLKETAEVLTLLGWSHYLSGDIPLAKDYCLKAIKIDPDFGPPYNDMGSYLLSEGKTDESLKWFSLAKNCSNYQHREYPYINSGRAYVDKKEYVKALGEFEKAFSFAPYNEELKGTIDKIKKSLKSSGIFRPTHQDHNLEF